MTLARSEEATVPLLEPFQTHFAILSQNDTFFEDRILPSARQR
ncbi:hypothetical protein M673_09990 [Aureimonas sp. AU20]|nr:hypothetical protein M673_09990 [Aureimonas sp. AU20]